MKSARKRSMASVISLAYAPPKARHNPDLRTRPTDRLGENVTPVCPAATTPGPREAPPKRAWPMSPMARPARGGFAEAQSPPRCRPRLAALALSELVGAGPLREVPKNYDDKMSFFETIINQEGQQCIQLDSIERPIPGREPCMFGTITDPLGNKPG